MHQPNRRKDPKYHLGERIKELNALHRTARILQDDERPPEELVAEIVALLPGAWQYPRITEARIRFDDIEVFTPGFTPTAWMQEARFTTRTGERGGIEVAYGAAQPEEYEGPFLAEERELIDSLAEMLRSFFQRRIANLAFERTREDLEEQVARRTDQLRRLASELSLSEARQRRAIAMDLHDHIGQALAYMRIKIASFRGDAVFCGFDRSLEEVERLLDQTIAYTRDLTFEISPPILYELGLESAVDWLAERFQDKHGLTVNVRFTGPEMPLEEDIKVTCFKCIGELLTNVVKHAEADRADLTLDRRSDGLQISVKDMGKGFDLEATELRPQEHHPFGLFSVRERIRCLGGRTEIESSPGEGTTVRFTLPLEGEETRP